MAADNPATLGIYGSKTVLCKFGEIDSTTAAAVVAANTTKKHWPCGLQVGAGASDDVVQFRSATTNLIQSPVGGALNIPLQLDPNGEPIPICAPTGVNEALNVARSAGSGTDVYAMIYYTD